MPNISSWPGLEQCETCIMARTKMRGRNQSTDTTRRVILPCVGISLDFGFICQKSKNADREEEVTRDESNGACLLLYDHKTPYLSGIATTNKVVPIKWMRSWLSNNAPNSNIYNDMYVRMDLGECGNKGEVRTLWREYGYTI